MKTIINWQTVNTRKKDKNIPKKDSRILCRLPISKSQKTLSREIKEDIFTSRVYKEGDSLFVMNNLMKYPFCNGFMWAYLDETEDIE